MNLLRHLECFVAVAEELHFGRAAARLHMAQPPLSQRIRSLERALGMELFVRSSRKVELTPAGRVLVVEAHAVLDRVEELHSTMSRVRGGEVGEVRVGVPSDLPSDVVAHIVGAAGVAAPGTHVRLSEGTTTELMAALTARRLDIGVVMSATRREGVVPGPEVEKALGVWIREDSACSAQGEVAVAELSGSELVLFPRDGAPEAYDQLLAACHAFGFAPRVVHHARALAFALGLVKSHGAVAFGTDQGSSELGGVVWRPLAGQPLRTRLSVVRREGAGSAAAIAIVDEAIAALTELAGWTPSIAASPRRGSSVRPASGLIG